MSIKPKKSRNQRPIHNKSAQRTSVNKSINRYKLGCQFTSNAESSEGNSMIVENKIENQHNDILSEFRGQNKSKSISQVNSNFQFYDRNQTKKRIDRDVSEESNKNDCKNTLILSQTLFDDIKKKGISKMSSQK